MPTTFIDGAKVIRVATGDFGLGHNSQPITSLAIAQYEDDPNAIYLFAVDVNGIVIGDLLYSSVSEAETDAERFYQVTTIEWADPETDK